MQNVLRCSFSNGPDMVAPRKLQLYFGDLDNPQLFCRNAKSIYLFWSQNLTMQHISQDTMSEITDAASVYLASASEFGS